jgi:hypothetical protein
MEEYRLIWNNEIIDQFSTKEEAELMRSEYQLAYNDYNIVIKHFYI